jgi:radical SAM superfamily enzyme YgiQ (UPF0313 family)
MGQNMILETEDLDLALETNDEHSEELINELFPSRSIKRILLVVPPDMSSKMFNYKQAKEKRYTNFPPYGFVILAEHLNQINIETHILNLHHELLKEAQSSENEKTFSFSQIWKSKLDEEIGQFKPDLIGLTCMFTMTHDSLKNVAKYLDKYEIPIAAGGVHVSSDPSRIFKDIPAISIVFQKEAEVAIKKFVKVVNNELPYTELAQIVINTNGEEFQYEKEERPQAEDMNIIPAYDLIDLGNYTKYGTVGSFYHLLPKETKMATALSNRGCRARCTFCAVRHFSGLKVRQRSIESVIDELELIYDKYGVRHIMWLDDDLLKDDKRAISLFNEMVKRNLKMTWDATNGVIAASCKDEIIAAAAESGCIGLHIGIESGNPEILRQIKKPGTADTFLAAAEVFRKYETIVASAFIMIGFPHETMGQIWDTINLCRQMDLDWYSIGTLQPLPGTPIFDSMIEEGLINIDKAKDRRFVLGPNGRAKEKEKKQRKRNDLDIASIPHHLIPTESDLTDIWFFMDYELNYSRLYNENRPIKIDQQIKQLTKVCDSLYKDHAFALYFLSQLEKKKYKKINTELILRLENKLAESDYWKYRFDAYGLSLNHLNETSDITY